jgi:hypothetical protein
MEMQWREIQSRILPEHTPVLSCAELAIADNTAQRSLDIFEQARALALLAQCFTDNRRLIVAAKNLGLTLNKDLIEKLTQVGCMSTLLSKGLRQGAIALPIAIKLHQYSDHESVQALAELLITLNISLNRQRELLDWVEAIVLRDRTTAEQVINDLGIGQILADTNLDRRQKIDQVRTALKKKRYPAIVATEKRFHALIKRLELPAGCQLIPPPYFEGNVYHLNLAFQSQPELVDLLLKIQTSSQNTVLNEIINMFKMNDKKSNGKATMNEQI